MKKRVKITVILVLIIMLLLGSPWQAFAKEMPDWLGKDINFEKVASPLGEIVKKNTETIVNVKDKMKNKFDPSTVVNTDFSKEGDKILGSVKVIYKDTEGNIIKTKVKTELELKKYEEKAIVIEGFKLVSKSSQWFELNQSNYEQLVVFEYKRAKNCDPVNPEDPEDPDPEDPEKPDPEDPEKPDPEDSEESESEDSEKSTDKEDENNETIIIEDEKAPLSKAKLPTDKEKLPKTGASSAHLFYTLGGLMSLSGGILLKKNKK